MAAKSARGMSLAHHLALAACRGVNANRQQISELVRQVYMAYSLQRMGFGDMPFKCYEQERRRSRTLWRWQRKALSG
jgi:hypothetical protein